MTVHPLISRIGVITRHELPTLISSNLQRLMVRSSPLSIPAFQELFLFLLRMNKRKDRNLEAGPGTEAAVPAKGREQAGKRPALVLSVDLLQKLGAVGTKTMEAVEYRLRVLLGLEVTETTETRRH